MKLTFLGTASGVPVLHRNHSSLLVEAGGGAILLDTGEGVSRGLLAAGTDLDRIDRAFISHTHPDHIAGLPLMLQMMHLRGRKNPFTVHCPTDRCDWVGRMLAGMFIMSEKWSFPVEVLPLPLAGESIGPEAAIRFFPTQHLEQVRPAAMEHGFGASAYGYILQERERRVVVSTDIDSLRDIADICAGASHLVIECTHVPLDAIFDLVRGESRMLAVVTHIPPEIEPEIPRWEKRAARELEGRLRFAADGFALDTEEAGHAL